MDTPLGPKYIYIYAYMLWAYMDASGTSIPKIYAPRDVYGDVNDKRIMWVPYEELYDRAGFETAACGP